MVEIDIPLQNPIDNDVVAAILAAFSVLDLTVKMDGTLKSFPGSRHWHLQRAKHTGTLEVTWWPSTLRLWVSYHENRVGDGWVKDAAVELAGAITTTLKMPALTD